MRRGEHRHPSRRTERRKKTRHSHFFLVTAKRPERGRKELARRVREKTQRDPHTPHSDSDFFFSLTARRTNSHKPSLGSYSAKPVQYCSAMSSSSPPSPLVQLVLLLLLVIVHASSTRTPEHVKSEDDSTSLAAAICQTKLFILLDTAVSVPFFASPVRASRSPMLQRFTPVNGTLEVITS